MSREQELEIVKLRQKADLQGEVVEDLRSEIERFRGEMDLMSIHLKQLQKVNATLRAENERLRDDYRLCCEGREYVLDRDQEQRKKIATLIAKLRGGES